MSLGGTYLKKLSLLTNNGPQRFSKIPIWSETRYILTQHQPVQSSIRSLEIEEEHLSRHEIYLQRPWGYTLCFLDPFYYQGLIVWCTWTNLSTTKDAKDDWFWNNWDKNNDAHSGIDNSIISLITFIMLNYSTSNCDPFGLSHNEHFRLL